MAKKARTLISFDWALKKLLRQKANFDILEGFLSELLKENVIVKSVLESESNKKEEEQKFNIVDILVEDTKGQLIIIEIQHNREVDYLYRMLFATSKVTGEYLEEGMPYQNIKKAYSINLLYFEIGFGNDYVYHGTTRFKGIHLNDELQLSASQKKHLLKEKVHEIFPEYYVIQINKFDDLAKDTLDEWIYFLKNTKLPENYSAKGLDKVQEKLDYDAMTKQQQIDYDAHQKYLISERNIIYTAKIEGKEEGIELGEHKKAKFTACQMKKDGMSLELIAKYTGLSIAEIEALDC